MKGLRRRANLRVPQERGHSGSGTRDWWMNNAAASGERNSVRDYFASHRRIAAEVHGPAVCHQYALKARVSGQRHIASFSAHVKENIVPLQATGDRKSVVRERV